LQRRGRKEILDEGDEWEMKFYRYQGKWLDYPRTIDHAAKLSAETTTYAVEDRQWG
jgi:hypothetical protein